MFSLLLELEYPLHSIIILISFFKNIPNIIFIRGNYDLLNYI